MTRFRHSAFALIIASGLASFGTATPTLAEVGVGDSPKLAFKAAGGQQVNVEALRGKYVLVDFWATWCGPCMAEADHMVQINKTYGPKGLVMLGVSLDQDAQAMKNVAKEKGFDWPQYFDGLVWKNKLAVEWGVQGVPSTFLIDPDGKVAWNGHPGNLDKVLEKAFKLKPPKLMDDKTLADAKASIATASAKAAGKDPAAAMKALAQVPDAAKGDARTADKYEDARKSVEASADGLLAAVQPVIDAKQYLKAAATLRDIAGSMKGTPTGDRAKTQLDELMAKPEVKAQLAALDKGEKAKTEMAAARRMQAAKQDDQAYARFKMIAKDFADTPEGTEAKTITLTYEANPAFVKRQNEVAVSAKAKSALGLAQAYARSGKSELAIRKYESVIADYAGTSFAEQAKREMAALPR